MIEAKKLAYADMLRYVADPRFGAVPVAGDARSRRGRRGERSRSIDRRRRPCEGRADRARRAHRRARAATRSTSRSSTSDGNIVSLIQSIFRRFGSGLVPPGTGFALHNRGGLFTLEPGAPERRSRRASGRCTRSFRAFMQKDGVADRLRHHGRLQPGAGARTVRGGNRRLRLRRSRKRSRPAASRSRRSRAATSRSRRSCPDATRAELRRSDTSCWWSRRGIGTFGWGQAVMSTADGVHFGALRAAPRRGGDPGEPAGSSAPPRSDARTAGARSPRPRPSRARSSSRRPRSRSVGMPLDHVDGDAGRERPGQ